MLDLLRFSLPLMGIEAVVLLTLYKTEVLYYSQVHVG